MLERFTIMLDCVDVTYLPGEILDELPRPSRLGATRVGGIDLNKVRARVVLAGIVALAPAPEGFTVAELTEKVHSMTGQSHTAPDRPPTTSASFVQKGSSRNRAVAPLSRSTGGRAHDHRAQRPTRSSDDRSSPVSAALVRAASRPPGRPSTATTNPYASRCKPSSVVLGITTTDLPAAA